MGQGAELPGQGLHHLDGSEIVAGLEQTLIGLARYAGFTSLQDARQSRFWVRTWEGALKALDAALGVSGPEPEAFFEPNVINGLLPKRDDERKNTSGKAWQRVPEDDPNTLKVSKIGQRVKKIYGQNYRGHTGNIVKRSGASYRRTQVVVRWDNGSVSTCALEALVAWED